MARGTITTNISHTVTLASASYPSPLTVAASGTIDPTTYGADGVYTKLADTGGARLSNFGTISGGNGSGSTIAGGAGVWLEGGSLSVGNSGTIGGGSNGFGYYGGAGVWLDGSAVSLANSGYINGGYGGGVGVSLQGENVSLDNRGTIAGGSGSGDLGAGGGAGLNVSGSGNIRNDGLIAGGGGAQSIAASGGSGGNGGAGAYLTGGGLTNTDTISAGAGGYGYLAGGNGGAGVYLNGGTLSTTGVINGGAGGASSSGSGGNGGAGVYLKSGIVTNGGTIAGGAAGNGYNVFGQYGDAVQFGSGIGTLVVDPGAVFAGYVAANAAVNDVLELAGRSSANLSGLGTYFTGFTTVQVEESAHWTLQNGNTLAAGSRLLVDGLLNVQGTLTDSGSVMIAAGGRLVASAGATLEVGSLRLSGGAVSDAQGASILIGNSSSGSSAGTLLVESGATLRGYGMVASATGSPVLDDGSIVAGGGDLLVQGGLGGTGTATISSGATLQVKDQLTVASVAFAKGGNAELVLAPNTPSSKIVGFAGGDTIHINLLTATSLNYANHTLTLLDKGHAVFDLHFAGNYSAASFALSHDPHGGTDISFTNANSLFPGGVTDTRLALDWHVGLGWQFGFLDILHGDLIWDLGPGSMAWH